MPLIADLYAWLAMRLFSSTLDQETESYNLVENKTYSKWLFTRAQWFERKLKKWIETNRRWWITDGEWLVWATVKRDSFSIHTTVPDKYIKLTL